MNLLSSLKTWKSNKDSIQAADFNIDLLNINKKNNPNEYFDMLISNSIYK